MNKKEQKAKIYNNNNKWFWLNSELPNYGLENGYIDYACLANTFNKVLCNNIIEIDVNLHSNIMNGDIYYYEDDEQIEQDIYQYFIIDYNGYNILSKFTNEIIFYSEKLNVYVWGCTLFGTSWSYVLTNIEIDNKYMFEGIELKSIFY